MRAETTVFYRIILYAVVLGYIAVRLWRLADSCLWFDEIFSVHAAEHPWNSILSFIAVDLIHPPLFYILLKIWIGIGGESLFWLRLFPLLFAVIAIFPFLALAREIKLAPVTQIFALFLFAVNGSLIKYAQEVRMYSPLLCLSIFSTWLFARYFVKGKSFVPLVIVNVLMVYTHYFGWLVVLSEVVLIVWFQPIKWRRILVMLAITVVSFVPWTIAVLQAAGTGSKLGQNIGWMSRPGIRQLTTFILNIVEPFYFQSSSAEPISIFRVSLPLLLIAAVALVLYWARSKSDDNTESQTVTSLFLFAVLPLIVAFAASWLLPYSIWGTRHLIIVFAPISVLIALAVTNISSINLRTAVITLTFLFSGYAFFLDIRREHPRYSWCAWEPLVAGIEAGDTAKLYAVEDLVAYHVWFGGRGKERGNEVVKLENSGISEDAAYFLPRGFAAITRMDINDINDDEFWIFLRAKEWDENISPLVTLRNRGYHFDAPSRIDAEDAAAFMVKVKIK